MDYFNNKIICDLIEQSRTGIIAHLDEACQIVGTITDEMFLDLINKSLKTHKHYSSWAVSVIILLILSLLYKILSLLLEIKYGKMLTIINFFSFVIMQVFVLEDN